MKLDRELAKKSLTDGFCLLYGEKFRDLFNSEGDLFIDRGIEKGREHYKKMSYIEAHYVGLWIFVEEFSSNKYKNVEEFIDTVSKELEPFLPKEVISTMFKDDRPDSVSGNFYIGSSPISKKIENALKNNKPIPNKELRFEYFEQFPVYSGYDLNLTGESGLGLDQFNFDNVEYYLEEHEEFYLSESIPYKYSQLGNILVREELRLEMIEKIKNNIITDRQVRECVSRMIKSYCFDSEKDSTLLEIQKNQKEGFKTPAQVRESLKNVDPSVFDGLENLFKK